MTVMELYRQLNERIPTSLSCDWDNDGLMCAPDRNRKVRSVLLALDITDSVANVALDGGYDVILSHHPLIFRPLKNLAGDEPNSRKLLKLIKGEIAAMSFHTRLDALNGGVNDVLASLFKLDSIEPFGHGEEQIGRIGSLPCKMELTDFAKLVKEALDAPYVNCVGSASPVSRIALVGGDGKDFMLDAYRAGADVYLTGSISYNMMVDASELGLGIVEAGHFFTEQPVLGFFEQILLELDPTLRVDRVISNPITVF